MEVIAFLTGLVPIVFVLYIWVWIPYREIDRHQRAKLDRARSKLEARRETAPERAKSGWSIDEALRLGAMTDDEFRAEMRRVAKDESSPPKPDGGQ